jgi:hypothetical protein
VDGIAAEIAIEVRVLLQNHDVNPSASEKKPSHHSRRSTADDKAAIAGFRNRVHDPAKKSLLLTER